MAGISQTSGVLARSQRHEFSELVIDKQVGRQRETARVRELKVVKD